MELFDVLRDPPRTHSPAAIWWWSGEPLLRARLRWQMERLVAGGVHNLVILNLAPSGPLFGADADEPPFLSEPWWELLDGVCEDAAELGAHLWFYDQLGFSGADLQARLVREHPEYAGHWLAADGTVTRRGFDYLSPTACATLIDRVHGEFERRLGHRFGNVIAGSFQDELPAMPTWSATFAEEFRSRRGRPFTAEALDRDPAARLDYHRTRADLAEEAFFRPLAEWHERNGLLSGCDQQDPARAGHPVEGVELYADYARTHRWFSAPGSDHHGDARLHSSLAHLYGRPRTWIESFHSSGWGGTLAETFDWLLPWLRAGANLYNPHAVYYTTKAGWWEWAPPSTDWRQPYWRHHRVFADAVTRLCAALSLGHHLCDIAVLFPTTTAQSAVPPVSPAAADPTTPDGGSARSTTAGLTPAAGDLPADATTGDTTEPGDPIRRAVEDAARAQRVYRELVGDMAWFQTVPGVLDRLCLDADVIDDDSVHRATVKDGRLTVSTESYKVLILPAATVVDEETAARLEEFVEAGGLLVAVEALPEPARLRARFASGQARFAASADHLGEALAGFTPQVEAPVPPLVREVDGTTVVFLTAVFPRASDVGVARPEERGVDLGWLDATYAFDPARYRESMRVRVRGVAGTTPVLASPFGGEPRALPYEEKGDVVEVEVPFDDGPAALLIFTTETDGVAEHRPRPAYGRELDLGATWEMKLVPTLDDTWGDFGTAQATVERWTLRDEEGGEVHATFGPHGLWRTGGDDWRPVVYSTSRGIHKDPIHREVLGPKGHVPEEFLDFGEVAAGQEVRFRTRITVPEESSLVVGAPTAKAVTLDGVDLPLDDAGHLALSRDRLPPGDHLLDLRLTPEEDLRLRAHVSLVRDPAQAVRPEWITGDSLETTVGPGGGLLQVASMEPCVVRVNGQEAGIQGGFDPYAEAEIPRVRRYDVAHLLRPGDNTITLATAGAVLTDGLAVSGPHWTSTPPAGEPIAPAPHAEPTASGPRPDATASDPRPPIRDSAAPPPHAGATTRARVRRRQHGDPAALHLTRRPHPLPDAGWIESCATALPAVLAVPDGAEGEARFLVDVPPGAVRVEVDAHGPVSHSPLDGSARTLELRVATRPGFEGGAALAGPVRFTCGPGTIGLGDWEDQGLAGYSGGVRYRTTFHASSGAATLDLGKVRGTAEVTIDGRPAGVRICSPYRFDLGELDDGEHTVDILVLGTLAPYLDSVSPTHFVFPGQRVTGLFGPVTVRCFNAPAP